MRISANSFHPWVVYADAVATALCRRFFPSGRPDGAGRLKRRGTSIAFVWRFPARHRPALKTPSYYIGRTFQRWTISAHAVATALCRRSFRLGAPTERGGYSAVARAWHLIGVSSPASASVE